MQRLVSCEFPAAAVRRSRTTMPFMKKPPAAATTTSVKSRRRDDADQFSGGGMVDEGMIVLRRRIHEMRAAETGWEPPAEWSEWEKEWYGNYDADVCALVGVLQAFLMSSRPGVGVGIVAAVAVSLPASAFVLLSCILHASQALLANLQH